jgi:Ca-activated chloride channel family protein
MPVIVHALFDYDRAVGYAQKEQWEKAGQEFKSLVTALTDRSDVLYDAGVVAYKNNDLEQAHALFEAAAQHEQAPRELKEKAYFNKANTEVAQKRFKEALSSYEQVLMLNAENEHAKHNATVVKKMLEQKNRQDQQDKQQNEQNKNDQSDQENKQDKQKNDRSNKKNKDQRSDEKNNADQNDSQKDDQSEQDGESQDDSKASEQERREQQKQEQKSNDKGLDDKRDQKNEERDRPDKQEQQSNRQQQQRRGGKNSEHDSQREKQAEQDKQSNHNASPEQDKQQVEQLAQKQNMSLDEKGQDLSEEGAAQVQLDPALERVLAKREDRDAQLNKQVIRAIVGETSGQHGQNSW